MKQTPMLRLAEWLGNCTEYEFRTKTGSKVAELLDAENEEKNKLAHELEVYLRQNEKIIQINCELSGYNRRLKRSCANSLSFFENYRLTHLHEMDDKEIKLSHKYLQEMQEALDEEEYFIKDL
jgi:hypothetical protein